MNSGSNERRPLSFSPQETVFENQYMRLYKVKADFGEFTKEYFVSDKNPKIGVMVWNENHLLLVRQYRYIINAMSWELPGGGPNEGETWEEVATRECFEESGITFSNLHPYFSFEHSVEAMHAAGHIFTATADSIPDSLPANSETDSMKWVRTDDFLNLILAGEVKEPMTMIALLKYCAENPDHRYSTS